MVRKIKIAHREYEVLPGTERVKGQLDITEEESKKEVPVTTITEKKKKPITALRVIAYIGEIFFILISLIIFKRKKAYPEIEPVEKQESKGKFDDKENSGMKELFSIGFRKNKNSERAKFATEKEEFEYLEKQVRSIGKTLETERQEKKKQERRKKVFEFFHGIGLVKTEEEKIEPKKEIGEKEELGDFEKEIRSLHHVLEEKKRPKRFSFFKGKTKKEKPEPKETEEGVLEDVPKEKIPGKVGLFSKLFERKEIKPEHKEKRKGKSKKFIKCHKLLLKAGEELQKNNRGKAKNLYTKAMYLYTKLEYIEKTELYDDLRTLYNRLVK